MPSILSLATALPQYKMEQADLPPQVARRLNLNEEDSARLTKLYRNSRIERRYSVLPDYAKVEGPDVLYLPDFDSNPSGTAKRNELYCREAPKLAEEACRKAIEEWGGNPQAITHVISVSCTGMMAPGIEFLLIDRLGLSRSVERLGINFMGCFGAFKGLAIGKSLAAENPSHRVLVVCTELCTLHLQNDGQIDSLISNTLFADGSAAVVIGQPNEEEVSLWKIEKTGSWACEDSLEEMTWEAGDTGYIMRLSAQVPLHIRRHIRPFCNTLVDDLSGCDWAIHPGGKAILHSVAVACELSEEQTEASWSALANYGNVSSPTLLFVLNELRKKKLKDRCVGVGFGPGLSMEGVVLQR